MEKTPVQRGRFAPSPSGKMHLGNALAMLLAWLDARKTGAEIVFRMEDLDPLRSSRESAQGIAKQLKALMLDWDEGYPAAGYSQSERTALYDEAFERFYSRGMVYPCYCTRSERLAHEPCRCKTLSTSERHALEASGRRPAWKMIAPDKIIRFRDGHYGEQSEDLAGSGDFIIKRSDGVYAYQLAVSVDDAAMGITRVVRGRDLLPSTARQIWLIGELGGTVPEYIHAPLIVSGGGKLSKRNGDTGVDALLKTHSPREIIGFLAKAVGLSDGAPASPVELLDGFEWDKIRKDDIIM